MKLFCVILLVCVLAPASLHAGKAICYFTWKDTNVPRCDRFEIYRDGALLATVTDTPFVDSTATWGHRHAYYLRAVRAGLTSGPSNGLTVLGVDWTQGATDTMRAWQRDGAALLIVALPYSRWTINWAYTPGIFELVIGHCDYDYDFDNGKLNLSDFCFFGRTRKSADELRRFGNCYQMQERMEFSR